VTILRESEILLGQVLNSSMDAVYAIDRNYCLLINNERHRNLLSSLGSPQIEPGDDVLHPVYGTEFLKLWKESYDRTLNGEAHKLETNWKGPDGKKHYFENNFSPLKDLSGITVGALVVTHEITAYKEASQQLHALTAHLQSVREEERKSMARVIHDEFGQVLSALKMNLSTVEKKLRGMKRPAEMKSVLAEIQESKQILSETVVKVRMLMDELRPELLDIQGLIPATAMLAEQFTQRYGIPCDFHASPEDINFDADSNIAIFRIVQEALTNISRHSGATSASIEFSKDETNLRLQITDNGRGFDPGSVDTTRTFGILGMKERAGKLGCTLEIRQAGSQGTIISLVIPEETL
jgi:signal transduction histidine kinase